MNLTSILAFAGVLGAGLVAGIFFAFSTFVMQALARIPKPQGIAAMQAINITVLNPWFFAAFFGTGVVSLVAVGVALLGMGDADSLYLIGGGAVYFVGCLMVTIVCNVPLNDRLAAVDSGSADGAILWDRYLKQWTFWNHIRTAASFVSAAVFLIAAM